MSNNSSSSEYSGLIWATNSTRSCKNNSKTSSKTCWKEDWKTTLDSRTSRSSAQTNSWGWRVSNRRFKSAKESWEDMWRIHSTETPSVSWPPRPPTRAISFRQTMILSSTRWKWASGTSIVMLHLPSSISRTQLSGWTKATLGKLGSDLEQTRVRCHDRAALVGKTSGHRVRITLKISLMIPSKTWTIRVKICSGRSFLSTISASTSIFWIVILWITSIHDWHLIS